MKPNGHATANFSAFLGLSGIMFIPVCILYDILLKVRMLAAKLIEQTHNEETKARASNEDDIRLIFKRKVDDFHSAILDLDKVYAAGVQFFPLDWKAQKKGADETFQRVLQDIDELYQRVDSLRPDIGRTKIDLGSAWITLHNNMESLVGGAVANAGFLYDARGGERDSVKVLLTLYKQHVPNADIRFFICEEHIKTSYKNKISDFLSKTRDAREFFNSQDPPALEDVLSCFIVPSTDIERNTKKKCDSKCLSQSC